METFDCCQKEIAAIFQCKTVQLVCETLRYIPHQCLLYQCMRIPGDFEIHNIGLALLHFRKQVVSKFTTYYKWLQTNVSVWVICCNKASFTMRSMWKQVTELLMRCRTRSFCAVLHEVQNERISLVNVQTKELVSLQWRNRG